MPTWDAPVGLPILTALTDPAHHLTDAAFSKNLGFVCTLHRAVLPFNTVNFGVDVASHRTGGSRSSLAANAHASTANHPVFLIVEG